MICIKYNFFPGRCMAEIKIDYLPCLFKDISCSLFNSHIIQHMCGRSQYLKTWSIWWIWWMVYTFVLSGVHLWMIGFGAHTCIHIYNLNIYVHVYTLLHWYVPKRIHDTLLWWSIRTSQTHVPSTVFHSSHTCSFSAFHVNVCYISEIYYNNIDLIKLKSLNPVLL